MPKCGECESEVVSAMENAQTTSPTSPTLVALGLAVGASVVRVTSERCRLAGSARPVWAGHRHLLHPPLRPGRMGGTGGWPARHSRRPLSARFTGFSTGWARRSPRAPVPSPLSLSLQLLLLFCATRHVFRFGRARDGGVSVEIGMPRSRPFSLLRLVETV